jgi:uncharacterized membrane protein
MKRFSIDEAIRFGWNTVRANLGLMVGLTIVVNALSGAGGALHVVPVLGSIGSWLLATIMAMGMTRIVLKFVDGGRGDFNDLFSNFDVFLDYLGASVLYGLIVVGGLCLLIVPGVIWAIRFGFFGYFILDRKLGAIDALKASSALTKGVKGDLFVFGLAVIGINILGLLCLGIGVLVTQPTTSLATGFVYRRLQAGGAPDLQPAHQPLMPPPQDPLIRNG